MGAVFVYALAVRLFLWIADPAGQAETFLLVGDFNVWAMALVAILGAMPWAVAFVAMTERARQEHLVTCLAAARRRRRRAGPRSS